MSQRRANSRREQEISHVVVMNHGGKDKVQVAYIYAIEQRCDRAGVVVKLKLVVKEIRAELSVL